MATELNLEKVYTHKYTKEKLIELIEKCYDKEFQVIFLPRTKDNADILIRSFQNEII